MADAFAYSVRVLQKHTITNFGRDPEKTDPLFTRIPTPGSLRSGKRMQCQGTLYSFSGGPQKKWRPGEADTAGVHGFSVQPKQAPNTSNGFHSARISLKTPEASLANPVPPTYPDGIVLTGGGQNVFVVRVPIQAVDFREMGCQILHSSAWFLKAERKVLLESFQKRPQQTHWDVKGCLLEAS